VTDAGASFEALSATGAGQISGAGAISRASVVRVGAATAISAVCGYAVLYLAARALNPAGFSVFGVFWGAFGLVNGAAYGLLQEATREVRTAATMRAGTGRGGAAASDPASHVEVADGPRTHPMQVATGVGVVAAVVMAVTSPLWAPHVFSESRPLSVILLCAGLAGFCIHATLLGLLAGTGRWGGYGVLMVTDAVMRVVIAGAAFVMGWGLNGFLWATVVGAVGWLLLLAISPGARTAAGLRTPGTTAAFLRGAGHSIAAAGASAILVMGFPVLLKATSGQLGAAGGVVILAVTLTRAPLLVPLTAMQGNLIAHFVDHRGHRLKALIAPAALVVALGAVGMVAAGLLGPWLIRVAFGDEYSPGGALLAWLTAGAVAIALLTVTGAATVAAALHRAYSIGWVGATVASAALLTLPLSLTDRTVVALLCGPLIGIAVHLIALARAAR
jgi:O-antigen/teichoic acid export membrane protein